MAQREENKKPGKKKKSPSKRNLMVKATANAEEVSPTRGGDLSSWDPDDMSQARQEYKEQETFQNHLLLPPSIHVVSIKHFI